jgi:hypothetical protein
MQALLDDLAAEIEGGSLDSVAAAVDRILSKPNEARKNMYSALEYVEGSRKQAGREVVGVLLPLSGYCLLAPSCGSLGLSREKGILWQPSPAQCFKDVACVNPDAHQFQGLWPTLPTCRGSKH